MQDNKKDIELIDIEVIDLSDLELTDEEIAHMKEANEDDGGIN